MQTPHTIDIAGPHFLYLPCPPPPNPLGAPELVIETVCECDIQKASLFWIGS